MTDRKELIERLRLLSEHVEDHLSDEEARTVREAADTLERDAVEVGDTDAEICQECGRAVGLVWWCHDDFLWEKVTGNQRRPESREPAAGIHCIHCFDAKAKQVCPWIEWAPLNLRHLQSNEEEQVSADARAALQEEKVGKVD